MILYYRNVYPEESFDWTSYQAFNLPRHVPVNRHPGLQEYIETLVTDVLTKLESICNFNLRIVNLDDGACIERFALDFSEFRHEELKDTTEDQVFDQFRSSLNSLIAQLEKLPKVKPGSVTFEIVLDAIGLSLGHKMSRVQTLKEKVEQDQDTNWVKCAEEGFNPDRVSAQSYTSHPRIKMVSLTGCDVGPLVMYQFMQTLLEPNRETAFQIYESTSSAEKSILFS